MTDFSVPPNPGEFFETPPPVPSTVPTNNAPTGAVTITGTPSQGQILSASHTLADLDGLGAISYQWKADGNAILGATNGTLALAQAQVGKVITVVASYTDAAGNAESFSSASTAAATNVNDPPTGGVAISGTANQGQTLTADNTLADLDGMVGAVSYQWKADGSAISGATSNTFTLTQTQVGKVITVIASYTDGFGTHESVTSSPTAAVVDTTAPTISSFSPANNARAVAIGSDLTLTFSETIQRGTGTITLKTAAGATVETFDAASSANLTVSGNTLTINPTIDLNYFSSYKVEFGSGAVKDIAGNLSAATSQYNFTTQANPVNAPPTGAVTITGTTSQSQVLIASNTLADPDGLGAISYQWKADGKSILGATNSTLMLAQGQVGKVISVAASYTDAGGHPETVTSPATSAVANVNDLPSGLVIIGGSGAAGHTLTVSNTLADLDGLGTISYQWKVDGADILGATSSTLALAQAQVGKAITVVASYTDGFGAHESVTSAQTVSVVQTAAPAISIFSPANNAIAVPTGSDLIVTFDEAIQRGTGTITLKTATGATVETFDAASSTNLTVSGNTLTINPTNDLKYFNSYLVEFGSGAVKDTSGNPSAANSQYKFTTQTIDGLYQFFVVAFAAAPGVTYMNQLADAYNYPLTLKEIVNIFTTKSQFTSVYPTNLTNELFANSLVSNIVKVSATDAAKASAAADIVAALALPGWSRGDVIYQVFDNLGSKPLSDSTWGNTARQFQNEIAVARQFTEVMHKSTTDLPTLRAVMGDVTQDTDVSTPAVIATLIGVELSRIGVDLSQLQ